MKRNRLNRALGRLGAALIGAFMALTLPLSAFLVPQGMQGTVVVWWLLALLGAGAGLLTVRLTHPAKGWGWLWRPLLSGLVYGLTLLLPLWLLAAAASHLVSSGPSRTVPVVILSLSGPRGWQASVLGVLGPLTLLYVVGACFGLLALRRTHKRE